MENFNLESEEEKNSTLEAARRLMGEKGNNLEFIGPDDDFEFECQQCGACCMNRTDIILSPYDIYIGAQYLGITTQEFLDKYTYHSLGAQSKIPMILLNTNKDNGFCPLLTFDYKNGGRFKCSINPVKPGACRNHPIGIMSSMEINEDTGETTMKTGYIKVEQCPQSRTGKMQNVRDWMSDYVAHEEEYDVAREMTMVSGSVLNWRGLFLMTCAFSIALSKQGIDPSTDTMMGAFEMMASTCIELGYVKYDTSKPFVEQCKANMEEMRTKFAAMTDDVYTPMYNVFQMLSDKSLDELLKEANNMDIDKLVVNFFANPLKYPGISIEALEQAGKEVAENEDEG